MAEQTKVGEGAKQYEFLDLMEGGYGVKHSYRTIREAAAQADKIGLKRMQEVGADGKVTEVVKDGKAWRRDGDQEQDLVQLEKLREHAEFRRMKELVDRANAAEWAGVPPIEPKHPLGADERTIDGAAWNEGRAAADPDFRPLDNNEFRELGRTIDAVHKLDPIAAALAADNAGRLSKEFREPPMETPGLRRAYLEAQMHEMDLRAMAARVEERDQRDLDPEKAGSAIDSRKQAEAELMQASMALEAEQLPESERDAFRREHGLDVEPGKRVDVATNLAKADARTLKLSEAAKREFDRYQTQEIRYADLKRTPELEEGYEINRLVTHARVQQHRLEKGEITPLQLEADAEASRGRDLAEAMDRGRAKAIDVDSEKGEIEATKERTQASAPNVDNTIEDFEIGAAMQARRRIPPDVEKAFPPRDTGSVRTHYYVRDLDRVAFVDKGDKLQSPRDFDQQGVRAMVAVAKARGWEEVKVHGSESFRRQVYLEAAERGIEVKGYKPTDAEKTIADRARSDYEKNQAVADAFAATKDREAKAEAAKQHPNLIAAYKMEAAATAFAKQHHMPPRAREDFVDRVRDTIERDLREGKRLPDIKVRKRQRERQPEAEQVR